jgi:hypothetical protein
MKFRLVLSLIWISGLTLSMVVIESYTHIKVDNKLILLDEDVLACMRPLLTLYGSYLLAILGFWFIKPIKITVSDQTEQLRYVLAVVCTILFNGMLLFFVSKVLLWPREPGAVQSNIEVGVKIATWTSFLVAPINLYFFGKSRAQRL